MVREVSQPLPEYSRVIGASRIPVSSSSRLPVAPKSTPSTKPSRPSISSQPAMLRKRAILGERNDHTNLPLPQTAKRATASKPRASAKKPITIVAHVSSPKRSDISQTSTPFKANPTSRRMPRESITTAFHFDEGHTQLLDMAPPDMLSGMSSPVTSDAEEGDTFRVEKSRSVDGPERSRNLIGAGRMLTPENSQETVTRRPSPLTVRPLTRLPTPPSSQTNDDHSMVSLGQSSRIRPRPAPTPPRVRSQEPLATTEDPSPNPRRKKSPRVTEAASPSRSFFASTPRPNALHGLSRFAEPSQPSTPSAAELSQAIQVRIIPSTAPPPRRPRKSAPATTKKTPTKARQSLPAPHKSARTKRATKSISPRQIIKKTGTPIGVLKKKISAEPGDDPLLLKADDDDEWLARRRLSRSVSSSRSRSESLVPSQRSQGAGPSRLREVFFGEDKSPSPRLMRESVEPADVTMDLGGAVFEADSGKYDVPFDVTPGWVSDDDTEVGEEEEMRGVMTDTFVDVIQRTKGRESDHAPLPSPALFIPLSPPRDSTVAREPPQPPSSPLPNPSTSQSLRRSPSPPADANDNTLEAVQQDWDISIDHAAPVFEDTHEAQVDSPESASPMADDLDFRRDESLSPVKQDSTQAVSTVEPEEKYYYEVPVPAALPASPIPSAFETPSQTSIPQYETATRVEAEITEGSSLNEDLTEEAIEAHWHTSTDSVMEQTASVDQPELNDEEHEVSAEDVGAGQDTGEPAADVSEVLIFPLDQYPDSEDGELEGDTTEEAISAVWDTTADVTTGEITPQSVLDTPGDNSQDNPFHDETQSAAGELTEMQDDSVCVDDVTEEAACARPNESPDVHLGGEEGDVTEEAISGNWENSLDLEDPLFSEQITSTTPLGSPSNPSSNLPTYSTHGESVDDPVLPPSSALGANEERLAESLAVVAGMNVALGATEEAEKGVADEGDQSLNESQKDETFDAYIAIPLSPDTTLEPALPADVEQATASSADLPTPSLAPAVRSTTPAYSPPPIRAALPTPAEPIRTVFTSFLARSTARHGHADSNISSSATTQSIEHDEAAVDIEENVVESPSVTQAVDRSTLGLVEDDTPDEASLVPEIAAASLRHEVQEEEVTVELQQQQEADQPQQAVSPDPEMITTSPKDSTPLLDTASPLFHDRPASPPAAEDQQSLEEAHVEVEDDESHGSEALVGGNDTGSLDEVAHQEQQERAQEAVEEEAAREEIAPVEPVPAPAKKSSRIVLKLVDRGIIKLESPEKRSTDGVKITQEASTSGGNGLTEAPIESDSQGPAPALTVSDQLPPTPVSTTDNVFETRAPSVHRFAKASGDISALQSMLMRRQSSSSSSSQPSRLSAAPILGESSSSSTTSTRRYARRSLGEELATASAADVSEQDGDDSFRSVVEVSSLDPRAAARAAAILKMNHAYIESGILPNFTPTPSSSTIPLPTPSTPGQSLSRTPKSERRRKAWESKHFSTAESARRLNREELLHEAELEIVASRRSRSRSRAKSLGASEAGYASDETELAVPGGWKATPGKRKRSNSAKAELRHAAPIPTPVAKDQVGRPWGVPEWKRLEKVYRAEKEAWVTEREVKPIPGLFGWAKKALTGAKEVKEWDNERVVKRFVAEEKAEGLFGEWAEKMILLRVKALEKRVNMPKLDHDVTEKREAKKPRVEIQRRETVSTPRKGDEGDSTVVSIVPPTTIRRMLGYVWSRPAAEESVIEEGESMGDESVLVEKEKEVRAKKVENKLLTRLKDVRKATPETPMRQVEAPAVSTPTRIAHPASPVWTPPIPGAFRSAFHATSTPVASSTSYSTPKLYPSLDPPLTQRSVALKALFDTPSSSSTAKPISIPGRKTNSPSVSDLVKSLETDGTFAKSYEKEKEKRNELRRVQSRGM